MSGLPFTFISPLYSPHLHHKMERNMNRKPKKIADQISHDPEDGRAFPHTNHYARPGISECIDIIKALGFNKSFNLGNALKYIYRCNFKGTKLADLKKARNYLNKEIEEMEAAGES